MITLSIRPGRNFAHPEQFSYLLLLAPKRHKCLIRTMVAVCIASLSLKEDLFTIYSNRTWWLFSRQWCLLFVMQKCLVIVRDFTQCCFTTHHAHGRIWFSMLWAIQYFQKKPKPTLRDFFKIGKLFQIIL